ncbi:hypothetical protein GCM10007941_04920 [Amphritea balenae]|nr:hypothetical protein GCM10007941_04920 [Amphritea balenae]
MATTRGDRIKAAVIIWVTFTYSLNPKPATFQNAVSFYRFQGVGGTGGIESTVWPKKRANQILIDADYKDKTATDNHKGKFSFFELRRTGLLKQEKELPGADAGPAKNREEQMYYLN